MVVNETRKLVTNQIHIGAQILRETSSEQVNTLRSGHPN